MMIILRKVSVCLVMYRGTRKWSDPPHTTKPLCGETNFSIDSYSVSLMLCQTAPIEMSLSNSSLDLKTSALLAARNSQFVSWKRLPNIFSLYVISYGAEWKQEMNDKQPDMNSSAFVVRSTWVFTGTDTFSPCNVGRRIVNNLGFLSCAGNTNFRFDSQEKSGWLFFSWHHVY